MTVRLVSGDAEERGMVPDRIVCGWRPLLDTYIALGLAIDAPF
jgi:hypothetical protein